MSRKIIRSLLLTVALVFGAQEINAARYALKNDSNVPVSITLEQASRKGKGRRQYVETHSLKPGEGVVKTGAWWTKKVIMREKGVQWPVVWEPAVGGALRRQSIALTYKGEGMYTASDKSARKYNKLRRDIKKAPKK